MALHLNSTLDMQSVKFAYFLEVAENTENSRMVKKIKIPGTVGTVG